MHRRYYSNQIPEFDPGWGLSVWVLDQTITITITPLWGDKVSMLTHIYPHKPRRKTEVTICKITRLTAHFMCGLMSDLLICNCLRKVMVIHDTECPYWDQVSLNNTKPTKLLWNFKKLILYYTILHHLCYAILHYTTLYYTILYYTILYYTIPILYYTITPQMLHYCYYYYYY